MKIFALIVGFLVLIFVEILRVYFIMPFPGSQEDETVQIAYSLQQYIWAIRLFGLALIVYPVIYFFRKGSTVVTVTLAVVLGFYIVVYYMFNYRFLADKMFLEPKHIAYASANDNKEVKPSQLIIGVTIHNESKAYPIQFIGYHHQVRDTVGGELVMVTYCTVCRTGRVFSPVVEGKPEKFRLVGMDHFNAMFEDSQTKSWWRQVNGESIAGPLKGKSLKEIPSEQMSLANWISSHPDTKILQPDETFKEAYESMKTYDKGNKTGNLTRKDSLSWNNKSWIVGIQIGMDARAYDWNDLQRTRAINDELGGTPLLVTVGPDSVSFRAFDRRVDNEALLFQLTDGKLSDSKTKSSWNWNGVCVEGVLSGKSLTPIQSYQEYWHSWRTFRPQSTKFTFNSNL